MNEYFYFKKEKDIVYKIVSIDKNIATLEGINYRKIIKADINNIEKISENDLIDEEYKEKEYYSKIVRKTRGEQNKKYLLGTVLHVDADKDYLYKSVKLYQEVGVYCYPLLCKEKDLNFKIESLNIDFNPDVIVITGHDYYNGNNIKDIDSYTNSKYFIEAVKIIRKKYTNSIIIAGACQSNFESLIASGAHFASSPKRINVHIYDPAIIAINICTTSFKSVVDFEKMGKNIENLCNAFGGVEVYGKMRILY